MPPDTPVIPSSYWEQLRELSSCLLPDFESLLWEGKIDKTAILDVSNFLNGSIGVLRDRNLDCWSIVLYTMLNVNYLAQVTPVGEAWDAWCVLSMARVGFTAVLCGVDTVLQWRQHHGSAPHFRVPHIRWSAPCKSPGNPSERHMSITQACHEEQEELLEWVTRHVGRQNYEQTHHSGTLDQFIISVGRVRNVLRTNVLASPPEKCMSFHNYRSESHPANFDAIMHPNIEWIALRVESVCAVIKDATGRVFKPAEIYNCIEEKDWVSKGRCLFYNVTNNPWPIKKQVFDENVNTCVDVPLLESELVNATLTEYRCIWMRKAQFDQVVNDVESGAVPEHNYRNTVITSNHTGFPLDRSANGRYNFWDSVTGRMDEPWFGYRAAAQSTFGEYCGAFNQMQVWADGVIESVEARNVAQGFGTISDLYQPNVIMEYFGYEKIDLDALPPAYQYCPFKFRDDSDDPCKLTGLSIWGGVCLTIKLVTLPHTHKCSTRDSSWTG